MGNVYKPRITTKKRDGLVSIWVNMPDGDEWNIWDLEKEFVTKDVLMAMASAFERGYLACASMSQTSISVELKKI